MIPKHLSQVSPDDLQALIDGQVREGKSLDYKRDLPGQSDEQKREFLADVSSFANSSGGDLIFGVTEDQGLPTGFPGVAPENMDHEIQRLENLLRTGIEPRLPSAEIRPIGTAEGRFILIVRARQSWNAPHRVTFRDHAKFYGRNSAGKYPLDVNELRIAFTQSDSLAERIRRFREDRLIKIGSNQTSVSLPDGAIFCLHLIPLSAFTSHEFLDLDDLDQMMSIRPPGAGGFNYRRNLDGHLNYTGDGQRASRAYGQLFRNGIVELVAVYSSHDGRSAIPSVAYERYTLECMNGILRFYRTAGVQPPIYLFLSLLNVANCEFSVSEMRAFCHEHGGIDRDNVILPEIIIDDLGVEAHSAMRPLFDMVWNAWGYNRSLNYDTDGKWVGRV